MRSWVLVAVIAGLLPIQGGARPRTDRVNLDVVGGDLRNVVRLLAEVGGVNLVIDDEVSGRVTVRLRGVRWDQALHAILKSKGCAAAFEGTDDPRTTAILRVARRETFAAERSAQLDERERCLRGAPLRTWTVRPSHARASELAAQLRLFLTPRGSVSVDARTNTVIIRDVVCAEARAR